MKKLFFLTLLSFFNVIMYSQDYKLSDFKTSKVTTITTDSDNFKNFQKIYSWFDPNNIDSKIDLYELVNPDEVLMLCSYKNSTKYNFCYIMHNKKNNTYALYFIDKTENEILVYNEKKTLLFSSLNDGGKIKLTNEITVEAKVNCFQSCMNYLEAQIADDFLGWAAWNLSPPTQIAAAYGCHRVCNGVPFNQVF
jgi:hypothetical protein